MKKKKLKRGDIVECDGKFYIFLRSDGRKVDVLEIKNSDLIGEITTVKRKNITIPTSIPEELSRYSIT